jgi:hypothetical protein
MYFEDTDRSRLIEALYRQISPFVLVGQPNDKARSTSQRPAVGLLLSYERASWKAILVTSWYPRGEVLFGK